MQVRRTLAAASTAALVAAGTGLATSTPAQAQPVVTGGLINVTVVDAVDLNALNNNEVRILNNALNNNQVNLGIAAQVIAVVCDVNVGVLATLIDTGTATCDAGGGTLQFTQVTGG